MTDPMTRIADALELRALAAYDSLEPTDRSADGDVLRKRIEARHSVPTVAVPVLPTTHAGNALVDELLTRKPPPDDDPEWRDVPAERCDDETLVRIGDRVWGYSGFWFVEARGRIRVSTDQWIKRHDHPARKPAPQTMDVLGSELRVGDTVVAIRPGGGKWNAGMPGTVARIDGDRVIYTDELTSYAGHGHRVRLPRPAEPSAKSKCPTCRCMIAPGTACACCESTSGDDPPLPGVDADVEPSASGEGIARLRHELLEIGAHSWAVGELHDQPLLMASRIVSAINAAHAHATRELRERCERAEHDVEKWHSGYLGLIVTRDALEAKLAAAVKRAESAKSEVDGIAETARKCLAREQAAFADRDAAIARAEAAERERDEALTEFNGVADERDRAKFERAAAIVRAEAAERVVRAAKQIGSVTWNAAPAAVRVILDALDAYDAARKYGAR